MSIHLSGSILYLFIAIEFNLAKFCLGRYFSPVTEANIQVIQKILQYSTNLNPLSLLSV